MLRRAIAVSSSGANELVAAATGKVHRVFGFALTTAGSVTAKFQSASTDLSGPMSLPVVATPGGLNDAVPLFVTVAGEALNLYLSGATAVNGYLLYDSVQV